MIVERTKGKLAYRELLSALSTTLFLPFLCFLDFESFCMRSGSSRSALGDP